MPRHKGPVELINTLKKNNLYVATGKADSISIETLIIAEDIEAAKVIFYKSYSKSHITNVDISQVTKIISQYAK